MVKLAGPALSLDASGTIGGVLTFSKWKGRPYVRSRVIPNNPKTQSQLAVRSVMKFLSQIWSDLAPADQATWQILADQAKYSPFNAFTSFNMSNWRDGLTPSKQAPAARVTAPATITGVTADAIGRYLYVETTLGAGAAQWGSIVYVDPLTGFTPNWNNARALFAAPASEATSVNIGPMPSGTYYIRCASFSSDGYPDTSFETESTVTIL